jgi:threonine dehydratase
MYTPETVPFPSLEDIRAARERLGSRIITTPMRRIADDALSAEVGATTGVWLKEELFQHTGSFKPRGALTVMAELTPDALTRGVTGVSAGNHAISLAYSARQLGTTAKVIMPRTANPYRIQLFRDLGGIAELVDTIHTAFERVEEVIAEEGRTQVHPFEGPLTALGTATVGLEFMTQMDEAHTTLDAIIVASGGGGLTGGIACAVKQWRPSTKVYVVEPEGADSLYRSFKAGSPQTIEAVRTIADSLGSPRSEPYSYALNKRFIDDIVLVSDDQIRDGMRTLFRSAKLVVEPAGAAAMAALRFPLREQLEGKQVGIVVCGGNTDIATYAKHLQP